MMKLFSARSSRGMLFALGLTSLAAFSAADAAAQASTGTAPAAWSQQEVGVTTAGAGVAPSGEALVVRGGGRGVGAVDFHHESIGRGDLSYDVKGYADEFLFHAQSWNGDGEIVARLANIGGATRSQAGIMVRSGEGASALSVFLGVQADGSFGVSARSGTALDTRRRNETVWAAAGAPVRAFPLWLKLVRRGAGAMAFTSTDGVSWQPETWMTARFEAGAQFGLAVASGETGAFATATFDRVTVGPITAEISAPPVPAAPTLFYVENDTVTLDVPYKVSEADRVELERATGNGPFAPVASITREGLYYDRSLASGTTYTYRLRAGRGPVVSGSSSVLTVTTTGAIATQPAIAAQPASRAAFAGESVTFVTGTTAVNATIQWQLNGANLSGATGQTLTIDGAQPANAGIYTANIVANGAAITTTPAVLGVTSSSKTTGAGTEVAPNILHPGGNTFDQVLMHGNAVSVTADPQQVTRVSFIDLSDDIVQVEFSGAGTLTIVLDGASGPATPKNYNQPGVVYMKGQANLIVTGGDETTHLAVFSVGRGNAVNPALFRDDVTYDGVADIGCLAILSANGRFGSVRLANASFSAIRGYTGIFAPGVAVAGAVYVGDIGAFDTATPVLMLGSAAEVKITGGDLTQANGRSVQVSGLGQLLFAAGSTSHGEWLPAQINHARLEQNGADVTTQTVVNPN